MSQHFSFRRDEGTVTGVAGGAPLMDKRLRSGRAAPNVLKCHP